MIDKSISFGQQNFLFVEVSEVDVTYDYVSYMTSKGSILIARFPKDGSSARYNLSVGVYATIFAARTGLSYVLPDALIAQTV